MVLLGHIKEPAPALGMAQAKPGHQRDCLSLQELSFYFKEVVIRSINHFFIMKCFEAKI
jgi:hypothetical protein